jgi:hypothetical protein
MIGIEGAVSLVLARLSLQMPYKVTELEARYNDNVADLRPPATYAASVYTRVELAQYPIIMIQPRGDSTPKYLDNDGDYFIWEFTYRMRIYLEERGNGYPQVEARRQRLTLGIREVLMSTPGLASNAWIDNTSFSSGYFGTGEIRDSDNRSIAATYTDLAVIVQEVTEPFGPTNLTGVADDILISVLPASDIPSS